MSRVLKNEVKILREDLMLCFRENLLSKQASACLSLPMIWMHVLVDREKETEDEEERRILMDEFDRNKEVIERGIQRLRQIDDKPLTDSSYSQTEACSECGGRTYRQGGCPLCIECGYSPCG